MRVADPDLPALVTKAQRGDRAAFEAIVRATARLVYAQAAALVRDRQRAEDLTQETFVTAWKRLPTLENPGGVIGWLATLARNAARDALRHDRRLKRGGGSSAGPALVGDRADLADGAPAPGAAAERAEAQAFAVALLEELPEEYRKPLAMRYLGGADYETIRGALGLTDGALRGLLTRGMALLRERMSRLER
jgi:RNA polymerase sigma-70 factor (ECF subfamily)